MLTQSVKRYCPQFLLIFILSFFVQSAYAQQLPPVTGASYDGEQISWNALAGASGYNIYLEFEYIDTVGGSRATTYTPNQLGEYRIAAFDDTGRFSPLQVIAAGVLPTTNIANVNSLPGGAVVEGPPVDEDPFVEEEPSVGNADQLPPVTGANFDGSVISWDELAGATGYNVYFEFAYIDTVSGGTSFTPLESGEYRIAGFDDDGRFSPLQVIDADVVQTTNLVVVNFDGTPVVDTPIVDTPVVGTPIEDTPSDGRPSAPQNVSLVTYSDTTAELFWDRPSSDENVVRTEIFRDGALLGDTAGTSFFDTTRAGRSNTAHQYELIAINANGENSLPAILNPGAFDGITEEEVFALMRGVSDVTNNNPHVRWFSTLRNLTTDENPLGLLSSDPFLDDNNNLIIRNTYSCEGNNPGTLVVEQLESRFGIHLLEFDSCTINGTSFLGEVSIVGTDVGGYNVLYDELGIAGVDIEFLSGEVSLSIGRASNFIDLSYNDFEYFILGNLISGTEDELGTAVVMNQVVSDNIFGEVRNTLRSDFSVSAPWTRGERLEISTIEQFTGADLGAGNYLTGEMVVASSSGNGAFISAETGDAETWTVDVFAATNDFNVSGGWADTGKLPCLSVTQEEDALEGCTLR